MENLETKIELLAKGKLTSEDSKNLLEEANSNSSLKTEINYQKYISKAIVEHRKLALKARLQAIQIAPIVGSGIFGGLSTNSILAIKSAAVVVASVGLGVSVYMYSQSNNSNNIAKNDGQLPQSQEVNTPIETVKDVENSISKEVIPSAEEIKKQNANTDNTLITPKKEQKQVTKSQKNIPNMLAFEDASQADINADLGDAPAEKVLESHVHKITTIDIVNVADSKYGFHYLLKDNKLTLYGKFDLSIYEIIERNNNTENSLYLFYNKNYYLLKADNGNIQKLRKLEDAEIITDLSDSRMNR